MTIQTRIYCVFPDRAAALQLARFLTNNPELEDFSNDGWWTNPETDESTYWCMDVVFGTGTVFEPVGEPDEEGNREMQPVPGFHVNILWQSPENTLPAQISSFRIYPKTPVCKFG